MHICSLRQTLRSLWITEWNTWLAKCKKNDCLSPCVWTFICSSEHFAKNNRKPITKIAGAWNDWEIFAVWKQFHFLPDTTMKLFNKVNIAVICFTSMSLLSVLCFLNTYVKKQKNSPKARSSWVFIVSHTADNVIVFLIIILYAYTVKQLSSKYFNASYQF